MKTIVYKQEKISFLYDGEVVTFTHDVVPFFSHFIYLHYDSEKMLFEKTISQKELMDNEDIKNEILEFCGFFHDIKFKQTIFKKRKYLEILIVSRTQPFNNRFDLNKIENMTLTTQYLSVENVSIHDLKKYMSSSDFVEYLKDNKISLLEDK